MQDQAQQALGLIKKLIQEWRYGRAEQALTVLAVLLLALYSALLSGLLAPLAAPVQPWAGRIVLGLAVVAFLWAFIRLWRRPIAPEPSDEPTRPSAIKGPSSFGPQDAALFSRLGRDSELRTLKGWLLDDQVAVAAITGESGVGKTSLVRAGLTHTATDEVPVLYWEALPDRAVERLLKSVRELWGDAGDEPETLDQLSSLLRQRQCVLVLDQFEQLSRERHPDVFQFLERVASQDPPFRSMVVVAFRCEYLLDWREFELGLPPEAQRRLRTLPVRRLSLQSAREAVAVLVEDAGLDVDRALVNQILEDPSGVDRTVSPTDIGIALMVLSELSSDQLAAYRNVGGQEQLLGIYLERVLDSFSEAEQEEVFRAMLHLADIEADQRIAEGRSLDELAEEARPAHRPFLEKNLAYLASDRARILERIKGERNGEIRYRLIHERLIPVLKSLTADILVGAEKASRLLNRKFRIWAQERKSKFLLNWRETRRIKRHWDQIVWGQSNLEKKSFFQRSVRRLRVFQGAAAAMLLLLVIGALWGWDEWKDFIYREQLRAWNLPGGLYDRIQQFQEIELSESPITRLDWLGNATSLRTLKLARSAIDSTNGLPASLQSLDLSDTRVSSLEGLPASLQSLNLSGTKVRRLERLPPSLNSLDLSSTLFRSLEGLPPSLRSLDLSDALWMGSLEGLSLSLQSLDLSGTEISSLEGLPPTLQSLGLSGTRISSLEGLPPSLQFLDLSGTKLRSLEGLPPSLQSLDLSGTRISSLEGLPPSLQSLDLSGTRLRSLEGLPPSLLSLNLSDTELPSLEGLPPSLLSLDLSDTELRSLKGLPTSLQSLNLSFKGIRSLEGMPPSLQSLDLTGTRIRGLEGLPPSLLSLDISATLITSLEGLPRSLLSLDIRFTYVSSLQGLPPSLLSLDISETPIRSVEGLPPGLQELIITTNRELSLDSLPESVRTLRLRLGKGLIRGIGSLRRYPTPIGRPPSIALALAPHEFLEHQHRVLDSNDRLGLN